MTYLHKCKCLNCGLHYIVCSEHENWEAAVGTPNFCPECGSKGSKLRWVEKSPQLIYQHVPGDARPMEISKADFAKLMKQVDAARVPQPKDPSAN
jgi:hypothetical protein